MLTDCPFCNVPPQRLFFESNLVVALWDGFPVSLGHALVLPRRHISSWFDATREEHIALVDALDAARSKVSGMYNPDGFNIGVNVGEAGGQTVLHLHVHLIPRYRGDVREPAGGVRHLIPGKGNYLKPQSEAQIRLVSGGDDPLLPHLRAELTHAVQADIAVAFVLRSGVEKLEEDFRDFLDRGGCLRILTGDYLGATNPDALLRLLDLRGNVDCRVFETQYFTENSEEQHRNGSTFHPKAYIFERNDGTGISFVGSSNLSKTGLTDGIEWNLHSVSSIDSLAFAEVKKTFENLFQRPETQKLTVEWIDSYRVRALILPSHLVGVELEPVNILPETAPGVPEPHIIQQEALAALQETRLAGISAGLVVLATGLGKTWLSAFDSDKQEYRRVLFVAHREEILGQALKSFRAIRPRARLGYYTGDQKDLDADVLFASIQTLGRIGHLRRFSRDAFDYIIVDEFHHASARTYRQLIGHFTPKFLLGLTATPERTDGGDLLALCEENLVYRCDLDKGIQLDLLSPFHYFGVPDEVDYSNIPWRSSRFDEEVLTQAVATQSRAMNALEQHKKRAGKRTLAFCVSQRHANFMADFFQNNGLSAVAVHSGPNSAPRTESIERLNKGDLDVVCAVDMFNEGIDLPNLDTVMMLRPTESKILWLQQFGRGLRKTPDKERLIVIDYIGNHRTFLLKPQVLFNLPPGDREILNLIERIQNRELEMPPGCEVTYELEAIDILRSLLRVARSREEALRQYYTDFRDLHGVRPTAIETHHDGYNPRSTRTMYGSWLRFIEDMGDWPSLLGEIFPSMAGQFLDALETTEMSKSFKMLVVLAMLNADQFPGEIAIKDLAAGVTELANRNSTLVKDLGVPPQEQGRLISMLEDNPVDAWTGGRGTGGVSFFAYSNQVFRTTFDVSAEQREAFQELARELADWRLAEYLDRPGVTGIEGTARIKVNHAQGKPILHPLDRKAYPFLPSGWTPVSIEGESYEANFVKIAVNVVRKPGQVENELPGILRKWFGPDAGAPGTRHHVLLEESELGWRLLPLGRRNDKLVLWQSYSREKIPGLFGLEFSRAIWNVGFVSRMDQMFLLVTLQKDDHPQEFQYQDRFFSPDLFQWQSQNRTKQGSRDGLNIKHHRQRGISVHLFVRDRKRLEGGGAAPFTYCGDIEFVDWKGDSPITVQWKLAQSVPKRLWVAFHINVGNEGNRSL